MSRQNVIPGILIEKLLLTTWMVVLYEKSQIFFQVEQSKTDIHDVWNLKSILAYLFGIFLQKKKSQKGDIDKYNLLT